MLIGLAQDLIAELLLLGGREIVERVEHRGVSAVRDGGAVDPA